MWPDRVGKSNISVERLAPVAAGELERFLTVRLRLYSMRWGRLLRADVEHGPWPLESARVLRLEQTLTDSLGLPSPETPPLVHFSAGVVVRAGLPHVVDGL